MNKQDRADIVRKFCEAMGYDDEKTKKLCEDDAANGGDGEAGHKEHILAAVSKLCDDGSAEAKEKCKKLMAILYGDMQDKPTEEDEPEKNAADADKKGIESPPGKGKDTQESLLHAVKDPAVRALLESEQKLRHEAELKIWVREQLDLRKIEPAPAVINGCLRIHDRQAITEHLDYLKTFAAKKPTPSFPRSQPPGAGSGGAGGPRVETLTESAGAKEFAKFIKQRR